MRDVTSMIAHAGHVEVSPAACVGYVESCPLPRLLDLVRLRVDGTLDLAGYVADRLLTGVHVQLDESRGLHLFKVDSCVFLVRQPETMAKGPSPWRIVNVHRVRRRRRQAATAEPAGER